MREEELFMLMKELAENDKQRDLVSQVSVLGKLYKIEMMQGLALQHFSTEQWDAVRAICDEIRRNEASINREVAEMLLRNFMKREQKS